MKAEKQVGQSPVLVTDQLFAVVLHIYLTYFDSEEMCIGVFLSDLSLQAYLIPANTHSLSCVLVLSFKFLIFN